MTLETFRTVLLATLVILLVFVLYRRLLSLLGKKKKNESYVTVTSWNFTSENKVLFITFHLPKAGDITLDVYDALGNLIYHRIPESLAKGSHTISEKIITGGNGKHYYKLITSNHEISHYFEVK